MTTETEWLGDKSSPGGQEIWSAAVDNPRPAAGQPSYTITEACQAVDDLQRQNAWWIREYTLLAEQLEECRESRERLRIRCLELEGVREELYDDIRVLHGDIDKLQAERDNQRAKANYPRSGW